MNVAILTGGYPSPDNPSKSVFNYRAAAGLQKYAKVTVYHFRFWKPGRPFTKRYNYKGVDTVAISLPVIPSSSPFINAFFDKVWMWLSLSVLKKELKQFDIFHSIGLGTAPIAAFLAKKTNKKHVSQAIGSDLLIYLPKKEKYFGLKKWTQHTNEVICNSISLQNSFDEIYPDVPSRVIYRGTDLKKFSPEKRKLDSHKITFLFLGGFAFRSNLGVGSNLKGGETLKLIIEELDKDVNISVLFKLGGPQSNIDELKHWQKQLNHSERVELLGVVQPDKIPDLMHTSHGVLIPSLSEGLPNVGVEACAAGALLVGSNVGGIPEIIEHHKTGVILKPGDTESWVLALQDIINNFEPYELMAEKSALYVKEYFDSEKYPLALLNTYKSHIKII